MTVRALLITLAFAGIASSADLRAQFDRTKSEARAAAQAGDFPTAETHYVELLQMAEGAHATTYEVYAEVVSPLADVYRKMESMDKLEALYRNRVDSATPGLAKGLAQADLGFFYQNNEFASVDKLMGEKLVDDAVKTFEQCSSAKQEGEQCKRRLADTAGIQGAMFFQKLDYKRAEPLFRRVVTMPESTVQGEVMLVSLHALRGILILHKQFEEAKQLELRAAAYEAAHPNALARLKPEGTRSRTR